MKTAGMDESGVRRTNAKKVLTAIDAKAHAPETAHKKNRCATTGSARPRARRRSS